MSLLTLLCGVPQPSRRPPGAPTLLFDLYLPCLVCSASEGQLLLIGELADAISESQRLGRKGRGEGRRAEEDIKPQSNAEGRAGEQERKLQSAGEVGSGRGEMRPQCDAERMAARLERWREAVESSSTRARRGGGPVLALDGKGAGEGEGEGKATSPPAPSYRESGSLVERAAGWICSTLLTGAAVEETGGRGEEGGEGGNHGEEDEAIEEGEITDIAPRHICLIVQLSALQVALIPHTTIEVEVGEGRARGGDMSDLGSHNDPTSSPLPPPGSQIVLHCQACMLEYRARARPPAHAVNSRLLVLDLSAYVGHLAVCQSSRGLPGAPIFFTNDPQAGGVVEDLRGECAGGIGKRRVGGEGFGGGGSVGRGVRFGRS